MSDKFISLDSLKEYNKQMKETYIKPLDEKTAELEGRVTTATFNITKDTTIVLQNLDGMTRIDWGDGHINSELTHEYKYIETESGVCEYACKIYDVTTIGGSAFYGCNSLTSVAISNSVTTIGDGAFIGCGSLRSVVIGDSVTMIVGAVFSGCSNLASVVIGDSVTSIGGTAFRNCSGLTSVVIPDSVTTIGYWAFQGCSSLTSVVIGSSVTSIGNEAFSGCSSLTSVKFKNLRPISYQHSLLFVNCTSLTHIYVPYGSKQVYIGTWALDGATQDILDKIIESDREAMMSDVNQYIPKMLPDVDETANGKILQVVDGAWTVTKPTIIYVGTAEPTSETGEDGDLYLQTD